MSATQKMIDEVTRQLEGQNWTNRPLTDEEKNIAAMAVQVTVALLLAENGGNNAGGEHRG